MNPECERECREFLSQLLTPKMVGKQLDVTPHHVTHLSKLLQVGTLVGHLRLFTPEDVREMERHRAANPYGRGALPRKRIREAEDRVREPVIMSPQYEQAIRKLRGEKP